MSGRAVGIARAEGARCDIGETEAALAELTGSALAHIQASGGAPSCLTGGSYGAWAARITLQRGVAMTGDAFIRAARGICDAKGPTGVVDAAAASAAVEVDMADRIERPTRVLDADLACEAVTHIGARTIGGPWNACVSCIALLTCGAVRIARARVGGAARARHAGATCGAILVAQAPLASIQARRIRMACVVLEGVEGVGLTGPLAVAVVVVAAGGKRDGERERERRGAQELKSHGSPSESST